MPRSAERKAAEEAALAAAASAQLELREQEEAAELQAAIDEAAHELKEAGAPAAQAALIEGDAVLSVEASADPDADADLDSVTVEGDAQQEDIADAEVQAAQDEFEVFLRKSSVIESAIVPGGGVGTGSNFLHVLFVDVGRRVFRTAKHDVLKEVSEA